MPTPPIQLTVTTFLDASTGLIGLALDGQLVLWRDGEPTRTLSATPSEADASALSGPEVELQIAPEGEPSPAAPSGAGERPCRIQGTVGSDPEQLTVAAAGTRLTIPVLAKRFDLLQLAAAWLDSGVCAFLAAVRPARAPGHDRDVVSAWHRNSERSALVADPRISITRLGDGAPLRLGLELWLESDDGESEYPRRLTGEITDARTELTGARLRGAAHCVHWRGAQGAGHGLLLEARPA